MEEIRSKYVKAFHKGLADLAAEGRECYPEIGLQLHSPRSRDLYRLFVCDVLEKKPDGSTGLIEFNVDPVEAQFPGLVGTRSLAWNSITFKCGRARFVEADLINWGERWIHDESPPFGAQDNLTGIIHSVTEPEISGEHISVAVDFGSAPLQAFEELLAILSPCLEDAVSGFTASDV